MPMVSPNQLLDEAKALVLDGREPSNRDDWMMVMNFMAYNISPEVADSACILLARIYDMPLEDDEILQIVHFQTQVRASKSSGVEDFLESVFGRSTALNAGVCVPPPVGCGRPATEFRDELSKREYGISGLCQSCQDDVFGARN